MQAVVHRRAAEPGCTGHSFLGAAVAWLVLPLPQIRDWIVPVNRSYGIAALVEVLRRHYPAGGQQARRVLIEYIMLQGINDTLEDAARCTRDYGGVVEDR